MTRPKNGKPPRALDMCVPKAILPSDPLFHQAVALAIDLNPTNAPSDAYVQMVSKQVPDLQPVHLGLLTQKKWPVGAVIPVFFLDNTNRSFVNKVLEAANSWGCNLHFARTLQRSEGVIVLATTPGVGHWCYMGTDCATMARAGHQTMNLDSFTLKTSNAEWLRVPPHEFGHGEGFPHGQALPGTYDCVDIDAVVDTLVITQGWTREMARAQVEHVLASEVQMFGANRTSVMTYPIDDVKPGCNPIKGGTHITEWDRQAALRFYPFPKPRGTLFTMADYPSLGGIA